MTPARDPNQLTLKGTTWRVGGGIVEKTSWRRNHGGEIMEKKPLRRNRGGEAWR